MSLFSPKSWFKRAPVVPVLRLAGAIGVSSPLNPGLSLASLAEQIEKAFSVKHAKAVALQINSPGGAPVQSKLIHDRIRALAGENGLPVYSFIEDVAASGGYWLCLAGDEVYGDASSIVGSIGVISAGFGFDRAIDKLGVDRRVYTAGARKMSLHVATLCVAIRPRRWTGCSPRPHHSCRFCVNLEAFCMNNAGGVHTPPGA